MKQRRNDRGTALMFAIFVLLILSTGTAVLWKQLHSNLSQQRGSWHREQAFQLAEAGLERAVAELRASTNYAGSDSVALGPGAYTVSVTPGSNAGEYLLESWGKMDHAAYHYDRAGLRGRLRLGANGQVVSYAWEPIRGNQP